MRDIIQQRLGAAFSDTTSNAGLLLDRGGDFETDPDRENVGKLSPDQKEELLRSVAKLTPPRVYSAAYVRWKTALEQSGSILFRMRARNRILVGHGNPSVVEVGMTLHRAYGVPYIPGSSLKGVLSHYLSEWGTASGSEDAVKWKGVGYDEATGAPSNPPGAYHGRIFGAPEMATITDPDERWGLRGAVVFEDAWYIPGTALNDQPLAVDVLTPHQSSYSSEYGQKGNGPNDWDSPVPVHFLNVRPGAEFLFAVTSSSSGAAKLAEGHLMDVLANCGVGGKTRAGYGQFEKVLRAEKPQRPVRPQVLESAELIALREAVEYVLHSGDGTISERFDLKFAGDELLDPLVGAEASAAIELALLGKHVGLKKRRGERLKEILCRLGVSQ